MQPTASKALSKVGIVRHRGRSGAWRGGAATPPPPPPVATSPRHCRWLGLRLAYGHVERRRASTRQMQKKKNRRR